jgi:branched-chain amino acid transport system ATP-binding protein
MPAHRLVMLGIALVPEGRGVFPRLTVEENSGSAHTAAPTPPRSAPTATRYYAVSTAGRATRPGAGTLSGGEQQMLAIGRALMSRPRLLCWTSRAWGCAPLMVQKIFETIRAIARRAA